MLTIEIDMKPIIRLQKIAFYCKQRMLKVEKIDSEYFMFWARLYQKIIGNIKISQVIYSEDKGTWAP